MQAIRDKEVCDGENEKMRKCGAGFCTGMTSKPFEVDIPNEKMHMKQMCASTRKTVSTCKR